MQLASLEERFCENARDIAIFLVYDRPERLQDRPDAVRTHFLARCVSEEQLSQTSDALREAGAYVELLESELALLEGLASGRIPGLRQPIKMIYNGIEGGITANAFAPGRKALLPAVADAYGLACSASNAYGCALGRHKYHYSTILRSLGVAVPRVWHYRVGRGWAGSHLPPVGTRVIIKSTYESWSVGVSGQTVLDSHEDGENLAAEVAAEIGQSVCVQEFVSGPEVCVPVYAIPGRITSPPVQAVLAKAPHDPDAIMTIQDNITGGGIEYPPYLASDADIGALSQAATDTFDLLELSGFARVDFRVDEAGIPWVIDVGVSPGISMGSSAYASLASLGFDHSQFIRIVVASSLAQQGLLP